MLYAQFSILNSQFSMLYAFYKVADRQTDLLTGLILEVLAALKSVGISMDIM